MNLRLTSPASTRAAAFFLVCGLVIMLLPTRLRRTGTVMTQTVTLAPLRAATALTHRLSTNAAEQQRLAALAARLAIENARLQTICHTVEPTLSADPGLLPAPIIARDPATFEQLLVISRGAHDGIRIGSPVVCADGIVGKITAVGPRHAVVQTIHASDFRVAIRSRRSNCPGLLGPGPRSTLNLRLASGDADFTAGDTLVTAGMGGIFPPGLAVGKVISVATETDALFPLVIVEPFARVSRLQSVFVLLLPSSPTSDPWLDGVGCADSLLPDTSDTR